MEKVEQVVSRLIEEFSKKPIVTTLKGVVALWVLKKLREWWNK